jgi:hypothetical protein
MPFPGATGRRSGACVGGGMRLRSEAPLPPRARRATTPPRRAGKRRRRWSADGRVKVATAASAASEASRRPVRSRRIEPRLPAAPRRRFAVLTRPARSRCSAITGATAYRIGQAQGPPGLQRAANGSPVRADSSGGRRNGRRTATTSASESKSRGRFLVANAFQAVWARAS